MDGIKYDGKDTVGDTIGDILGTGNQGIHMEELMVNQDIKIEGLEDTARGAIGNQGIQEEMGNQDIKGAGNDVIGITINDRSSIIMAKEGHTHYQIDDVVNMKNKSNRRTVVYEKRQMQCQSKCKDNMLSIEVVPRDHSYELSQWRKKDHTCMYWEAILVVDNVYYAGG